MQETCKKREKQTKVKGNQQIERNWENPSCERYLVFSVPNANKKVGLIPRLLNSLRIEGRILLRESSQGESSGLRVRLEGSLKTHYDAYSLPANAYSLRANAYSLPANAYSLRANAYSLH